MLKRHEDALAERIDAVAWRGYAFIEWWELNAWYGKDRIGRNVWRDLRVRFDEAVSDEKMTLYIYQAQHGVMLVHSDNLRHATLEGLKEMEHATEKADAA